MTVLLIEDNLDVAILRASVFENLGCEVRTALSVAAARDELAAIGSVDVVVTDINLGDDPTDQSGLEIARRVRERSDIPIVAYSAAFTSSELSMEEHPEIARWFVKGDLGLGDLGEAMEEVVHLGRSARTSREE